MLAVFSDRYKETVKNFSSMHLAFEGSSLHTGVFYFEKLDWK